MSPHDPFQDLFSQTGGRGPALEVFPNHRALIGLSLSVLVTEGLAPLPETPGALSDIIFVTEGGCRKIKGFYFFKILFVFIERGKEGERKGKKH